MRILTLLSILVVGLLTACGSGGDKQPQVLIATVTTNSLGESTALQAPLTSPVLGVKPQEAATTTAPSAGSTPATTTTAAATATATRTDSGITAVRDPAAPTTGRWIDVDVTRYRVQLMEGMQVMRSIEPVAVGAQINTGAYESTQTGLFHVYNKIAGLQYDAPYSAYISDWVAFDPAKANGFHSFLLDKDGKVVDSGTGRISNGCIRVADAKAVFAFAEIGTPVYVHT